MYRLKIGILFFAFSASQIVLAFNSCGEIVGESHTSSTARVCATKELEKEEKTLKRLEGKIEKSLSGETGLGLTRKSFQKAQKDWKAYRDSSCWLEAAFVGEPTAAQLFCEAQMTSCRVQNLTKLLADITGEIGEFSATKTCP